MVGNNQVSSGNLLQLVKDSNELTNFIKQGLSDGSIKVNDLLENKNSLNDQIMKTQEIITKFRTNKSSEIASSVLINNL